jgi:hypothetical protein
MAIAIDNVFFPDRLATKAGTVRRRLTFVKTTETGFEPFRRAVYPHSIGSGRSNRSRRTSSATRASQTDVETVYHMWETAQGAVAEFLFPPAVQQDCPVGQGTIVGGLYYQIYSSKTRRHCRAPGTQAGLPRY